LKGITVQHLQETGIGKTVNSLRKHSDPEVCMASKSLVAKWKAMVADESDEDHQQANENGNDEDDEDGGNPKNNFQSDSNGKFSNTRFIQSSIQY
jgi:transcription elongation factor B polypeptide 3